MLDTWRRALNNPHVVEQAKLALVLFKAYLAAPLPRVPRMAAGDRLAIRIDAGRTVEEAAAREYLYRWELAILPPDQAIQPDSDRHTAYWNRGNRAVSIFGTPHPVGL